jgi:hypothetical protein
VEGVAAYSASGCDWCLSAATTRYMDVEGGSGDEINRKVCLSTTAAATTFMDLSTTCTRFHFLLYNIIFIFAAKKI